MPITDSDRDWERFGQSDPYFAVLTDPEFHGKPVGDARARFFESGEDHIETVLSIIRERLDPGFTPQRALDFGCGVGRLLIPLAARCREVTGVDVSPSMLSEAKRNCVAAGVSNVSLVQGDDELSALKGPFEFIHTYIVLQHIPVVRGERLVRRLASMLVDGGISIFHVPYSTGRSSLRSRLLYWARHNAPGVNALINLSRRRAANTPLMQMNAYSITRLLDILSDEGCQEVHVRFSNHNGARGVMLFARKSDQPIFY